MAHLCNTSDAPLEVTVNGQRHIVQPGVTRDVAPSIVPFALAQHPKHVTEVAAEKDGDIVHAEESDAPDAEAAETDDDAETPEKPDTDEPAKKQRGHPRKKHK